MCVCMKVCDEVSVIFVNEYKIRTKIIFNFVDEDEIKTKIKLKTRTK